MGSSIISNSLSMRAQRNLYDHQARLENSLERLSSGYRINNSWDDPAGLGISERFRAQIGAMTEAERNANANMNVIATAEGALITINDILIRMKALSIQASNGALTDLDRQAIDIEYQQLKSEITRIARTTEYGSFNLLDGTYSATGIKFHIGIHNTALDDYYYVNFNPMMAANLGLANTVLSTTSSAQAAIELLDEAINSKDIERVRLGSYVERLQHTVTNYMAGKERAIKSNSEIRDTDVAREMTDFTQAQIMMQAGAAMLSQANMIPQIVAGLIG